jgi:hypothetical protein
VTKVNCSYEFCLGAAVTEDHLVRKIDTALDLCWLRGELRSELSPHYSSMGRPSIDPTIRMLVVGCCNPLGAIDLPRSASEPRLSLVLQARHRRCHPYGFTPSIAAWRHQVVFEIGRTVAQSERQKLILSPG